MGHEGGSVSLLSLRQSVLHHHGPIIQTHSDWGQPYTGTSTAPLVNKLEITCHRVNHTLPPF